MRKISYLLIAVLLGLMTYPAVSYADENPIHKEIIYDILVDRYNNGNYTIDEQVRIDDPFAYHGGDLEGIILKLDDLKELGFTSISLSPIMNNAKDGYHGYWIEDFYTVEEQFGSMEDFQRLVEEVHNRDMKIILELVIDYVANSHPIVTDPEKTDWTTQESKLTSENEPWLENAVPLNLEHPEVQEMLLDVAMFWVNEGNIDGIKIHAADQAPVDFIQTLSTEIKTNHPDVFVIADVLSDQVSEELFAIDTVDAVENPELSQQIIDVFSTIDTPVENIYTIWEVFGNDKGLIYVDNKTMDRFTQIAAENKRDDVNTWSLALTYLLTTPGVASIYQGSDIPMYGSGLEQVQQLVNFNSGDQELEKVFSKVLALRTQFPALQYGDFELVGSTNGMSVFKRAYQNETMYIAINNDSVSRYVSLTELDSGYQLRGLLGDNLVRQLDNGEYRIGLARETADVFIVEEDTGINWFFITPIVVILILFISAVIYLTRKQKKREAN